MGSLRSCVFDGGRVISLVAGEPKETMDGLPIPVRSFWKCFNLYRQLPEINHFMAMISANICMFLGLNMAVGQN